MMINIHELLNKMVAFYGQKNLRETELTCRQILQHDPQNSDAHHFLGLIAWDVGKLDIAKHQIGTAIRLNPSNSSCYLNMGNVFQMEKKYEESLEWYQKALKADTPEKDKILNSIGVALTRLGRLKEAIENLSAAIELSPGYVDAHNNLGEAFKRSGRIEDALASCDKAIALHPQFVLARWNRSILLLLLGRLSEAWPEYEWRWKRPQAIRRETHAGHNWEGQSLSGKNLLVYEEQGMGDAIQFIRYLPALKRMGGGVILEVSLPLARLIGGCPGVDRLWIRQKDKASGVADRVDYHVPLLSLPGLLNTTLENIPVTVPYLEADTGLARIWKERLGQLQGLRVGIVWAGNPDHTNDHNRSVPLHFFKALADIDHVTLISLQMEKYDKWTRVHPMSVVDVDLGDQLSDFAETSAIIENIDLLISVDTAIVHLAGAMGKKVWTLLPFCPDWRWLLDRSDSPWYPTMRLFRQPQPGGDWTDVMKKVRQALISLAAN